MNSNSEAKWDFFLAHAAADNVAAENLYNLLINSSRVFLDSCCLKLGDNWDVELAWAQKASRVSVILVSSSATQAYYQREEIAAAIALASSDDERHRVVPLYLPGADRNAPTTPYGLRLKHSLALERDDELPSAAKALLNLLEQLNTRQDSAELVNDVSKQTILEQLLAQLSANCAKAKALEVEARIFGLVRNDVDLLLANANQYVAPAREAIAVVAGRILHGDSDDRRLVELLERFTSDPDKWVRKKAQDGLTLAGY